MRSRFPIAIRLLLPCFLPLLLGMTSSDAERFIAGCARSEATATSLCHLRLGDDFGRFRNIPGLWKTIGDAPSPPDGFDRHLAELGPNGSEEQAFLENILDVTEMSGKVIGVSLHFYDSRVRSRPQAYAEERRLDCLLAGHPAKVIGGRGNYTVLCGHCPVVLTGCFFSMMFMEATDASCKAEGSEFCSFARFSSSPFVGGEFHLFNPALMEKFNDALAEKRAIDAAKAANP